MAQPSFPGASGTLTADPDGPTVSSTGDPTVSSAGPGATGAAPTVTSSAAPATPATPGAPTPGAAQGGTGARGKLTPAARHPAPVAPGRRRPRRYALRGRHVREHRLVRVGVALAAADIAVADDLLVLQVLRLQPLTDLDTAQVSALSALPPSIVASSLDRLVRSGLARDLLVGGRVRFGLP